LSLTAIMQGLEKIVFGVINALTTIGQKLILFIQYRNCEWKKYIDFKKSIQKSLNILISSDTVESKLLNCSINLKNLI